MYNKDVDRLLIDTKRRTTLKTIPMRKDVDKALTWDLTSLCKDSDDFKKQLEDAREKAHLIKKNYQGKIDSAETLIAVTKEYADIMERLYRIGTYAHMAVDVDMANTENLNNGAFYQTVEAEIMSTLSFVESEAKELNDDVLAEVRKDKACRGFVDEIIRHKPHMLGSEAEMVLKALSSTFSLPIKLYTQAKLVDLSYPDLELKGENVPFGFVTFESSYDGINDTETRRKAFDHFSKHLKKYQNTLATALNAQMQLDKTKATLRGYDSVFDYLLFDQKVTREMYDRQIDRITQDLAPAMRKYATLLKEIHGLDRMTFADLKISVDPSFSQSLSVEESREYIFGALEVYGDEYLKLMERAYDERWVDFAFNQNKSSGAYCASPYGDHPYVLMSWSDRLEDIFTLVHELGHAGQGYYSQKYQSVFEESPTLYLIESPSTLNELLMANYLLKKNPDDIRFKRWVISSMISNTYYHNFITHLLEADFQRECYKLVDKGQSLSSADFNRIKRQTLEKFWGDAVEINEGAELTWMRQPHYYMGLYPYTYSAGLTVATAVNHRLLTEGDVAIKDWIEVLKLGGSVEPLEFAQRAGVDISTDKPLMTTIEFISGKIDELVEMTKELKK